MNKYTVRRIWAVIVLILAIIGAVKTVQFMGDFLNEDFACKTEVVIRVESGDAITTLAEEQIKSKNCTGYKPLVSYLVNQYGTELQPGDRVQIPLNG